MLVDLRPLNEALLRARVSGAQVQPGSFPPLFIVGLCEQEGWFGGCSPILPNARIVSLTG